MRLSCRGCVEEVRLGKEAAVIGSRRIDYRELRREGKLEAIEIDGKLFRIRVAQDQDRVFVWCAGRVEEFRRVAGLTARSGEHGGDLLAPMPGRVQRILVVAGDRVARGQVVMILEAMKMEHAIRAPREGTVTRLAHREGDLVEAGVTLAEIA